MGVPYMARPAATPAELWAVPEPDEVCEGELPPEVCEAVPEGDPELEAAARVVPLPHCWSRARVHWNCAVASEPVRLMQVLYQSRHS